MEELLEANLMILKSILEEIQLLNRTLEFKETNAKKLGCWLGKEK